jgi:hypothetical protein
MTPYIAAVQSVAAIVLAHDGTPRGSIVKVIAVQCF